MKTIYSLKEFHEKAVAISGKHPNYVAVSVEFGVFGKVEFRCYADGYKNYLGATMEESLEKLLYAVNPPAPKNIDVEIDLPQTETQCQ